MADKPKDIESIYNAALKKSSGAERTAYLDAVCGDDNVLRDRIEALLKAHEKAGDFLKILAIDANVTIDGPQIEGPGTKIGRYELLERIGEGGMGLVYLAEQKEPVKRRVALKIIKPGMDSKQVVARFEAERQALALLDHPNIAHVFDAGTTEAGRLYFVMEHVKGMSITRYCDDRKLNIEQRLKLFKHVCEGIHHAHQKGIIHRDIKPSNILVSVHGDRAVPKIIDFGIAKATARSLTDKTVFTCQGQLLGTPEYMSPEQVDLAIQDIDTRSDIYSLGVVLYELLAGVLPFERDSLAHLGFAEVQRTIREQEPATPSIRLTNLGEQAKTIAASRDTHVVALARRLHRELEWIPLKAMRKDRCRRYRSASEMADDIRNYMNGLPLIAGPETAAYRVKKFVHKHAGSVATVVLVVAAIVLGLIVSTAMYFEAEYAKDKETVARTRAEQAEKIAQEQRTIAEQKAEDYRRSLYINSIQLADAKYKEGNAQRVRSLLDSCPEELRGWEWNRLNHVQDESCLSLQGHVEPVIFASFSPDGKRIVSGSHDKTVKLWDAETGTELMTMRGHEDKVRPVSFNPDGRKIVSGSMDKTIKVWDTYSGLELMTLRGHDGSVWSVSFSPDGERILSSGDDNTIKIWDVNDGSILMTIRTPSQEEGNCAVFSPDGKHIATYSIYESIINVLDAKSGVEVMKFQGNNDGVNAIALNHDSSLIASVGEDDMVKLWDVLTGAELRTMRGHQHSTECVAFSPDGQFVVSGGWDQTVKVWDVATGLETMTLHGHEAPVRSVAFSNDGNRIVTASLDGAVKVWNVDTDSETLILLGHKSWVRSIAFSPDGTKIVSGSADKTIKVWDIATGTEVITLCGHDAEARVAFSPDGKHIVSGSFDNTIKLWDAVTGTETKNLHGHEKGVRCVAFSHDGKRVVSGSEDKTIKVWDAQTGMLAVTLTGHEDEVTSVAFSVDGSRIISGSWDKTIKVWDSRHGTEIMTLRGHEYAVSSVAFSLDGRRIVSGSRDNTAKVWDAKTGELIMTLSGHRDLVLSASFSPDGKRIVTGSQDLTVKVWDAENGFEILTLRGHTGYVSCVRFSPYGNSIASSGGDGSIKIWESNKAMDGYEARRTGVAARKLLDKLREEHGLYFKVIDELNADETLDESIRKVALQIANARLWEDANDSKESLDDGDKE